MKYLKYFKTEAEYTAYKDSEDFVTPNVSYIEETQGVSYEPYKPYIELPFKMIDLGLPSGLLWADRNIGASSPEDFGLYFRWGETVGYTAEQITSGEGQFGKWSDYFDTTDGGSTCNKYTIDKLRVLQPEDDAATVNMGADYRMPTESDFNELINNCTATFIDLQGNEFSKSEVNSGAIPEDNLKGVKFTGSNGNSIFIPTSSYCSGDVISHAYSLGMLWSSSLHYIYHDMAYHLNFLHIGYVNVGNNSRAFGMCSRGVCSK